jgi:hypothetical protein
MQHFPRAARGDYYMGYTGPNFTSNLVHSANSSYHRAGPETQNKRSTIRWLTLSHTEANSVLLPVAPFKEKKIRKKVHQRDQGDEEEYKKKKRARAKRCLPEVPQS